MSLDLVSARRRSAIMIAISVVAGVCALASIIGYLKFHQAWAMAGFFAAVLAGFGAQIWFIAGLRGPGKGA